MTEKRDWKMLSVVLAAILVAPMCLAGCSDEGTKPEESLREELYVLNEKSNSIMVFEVPGLEQHGEPVNMVNAAPHHLEFDHAHVYYFIVGRKSGGFVDKYDAETNEHLASSTVAHFWTGIATSHDAQHVYVTDFGETPDQRTRMYILQHLNLELVDSITCGSQPHYMDQTEDGETIVIVNTGSDELTYYYPHGDPDTNVVSVKLDPVDPAPLGQPALSPYSLDIAGDDSLAYVCCRKSKWDGQAAIFVVDIVRRMTIDTILVPWTNRSGASSNYHMGLCMLLDNDRYVAVTTQDGNSVLLVDVTDGSHDEVVVQHDITFGITATSDEKHLYVTANNGNNPVGTSGWVYEFLREGGSLTPTDSVEVGLLPNGIHVKPGGHTHEE